MCNNYEIDGRQFNFPKQTNAPCGQYTFSGVFHANSRSNFEIALKRGIISTVKLLMTAH